MNEPSESLEDVLSVKRRRLMEERFGESDWDSRTSFFKEGDFLRHFTGIGLFTKDSVLQLQGGTKEETGLSGKTPREVVSIMQEIQALRDEMVLRGYAFFPEPACEEFYAYNIEKSIATIEALREELSFLLRRFGTQEVLELPLADEEVKLLEESFGPNDPENEPYYDKETDKMGPLLSGIHYSSRSILEVNPPVSEKKLLTLTSKPKQLSSESPEGVTAFMEEIARLEEILQKRHYVLKPNADWADYEFSFEKKVDGIAALREEIAFLVNQLSLELSKKTT